MCSIIRLRIRPRHAGFGKTGLAPLNLEGTLAFRRVTHLLPGDVPIILETPVQRAGIEKDLEKSRGG
jgi:hypothetical protein